MKEKGTKKSYSELEASLKIAQTEISDLLVQKEQAEERLGNLSLKLAELTAAYKEDSKSGEEKTFKKTLEAVKGVFYFLTSIKTC